MAVLKSDADLLRGRSMCHSRCCTFVEEGEERDRETCREQRRNPVRTFVVLSGLNTKSRHRCHVRHVWRKQMTFSVLNAIKRPEGVPRLMIYSLLLLSIGALLIVFFIQCQKCQSQLHKRSPEVFSVLSDQQLEMQQKYFIYSFETPEQESVGQFFLRNHLNGYLFFLSWATHAAPVSTRIITNIKKVSVFSVLTPHIQNCHLWVCVRIWPSMQR